MYYQVILHLKINTKKFDINITYFLELAKSNRMIADKNLETSKRNAGGHHHTQLLDEDDDLRRNFKIIKYRIQYT